MTRSSSKRRGLAYTVLGVLALAHCGRSELYVPSIAEGAGTDDAAAGAPDTGAGSSSGGGSSGSSSSGGVVTPPDAGPPPPSCAPGGPGLTDCGVSKESCCISLEVAGGTFDRTYDPTTVTGEIQTAPGGSPLDEADPATVSSFRLDKYLVTVGRYRQFVQAWAGGAGFVPAAGSGKHTHLNGGRGLALVGQGVDAGSFEPGWESSDEPDVRLTEQSLTCAGGNPTWTASPAGNETLPITCVDWPEAYAFCIWDGGFLPSEAEWEYATAGGSEQREFPWGSNEPGTASTYAIYGCLYGAGSPGVASACANGSNVAPVGQAPAGAGLWGQLDLVGNVSTWVLDVSLGAYSNPCVNCAESVEPVTSVPVRCLRGADFSLQEYALSPAWQTSAFEPSRSPQVGFRCARTP